MSDDENIVEACSNITEEQFPKLFQEVTDWFPWEPKLADEFSDEEKIIAFDELHRLMLAHYKNTRRHAYSLKEATCECHSYSWDLWRRGKQQLFINALMRKMQKFLGPEAEDVFIKLRQHKGQ